MLKKLSFYHGFINGLPDAHISVKCIDDFKKVVRGYCYFNSICILLRNSEGKLLNWLCLSESDSLLTNLRNIFKAGIMTNTISFDCILFRESANPKKEDYQLFRVMSDCGTLLGIYLDSVFVISLTDEKRIEV